MEHTASSTPQRLFNDFLCAQVSFPHPDASSSMDDLASQRIIHRQYRFPESANASADDSKQMTNTFLQFCLPATDPWLSNPGGSSKPGYYTQRTFSASRDYVVHDVVLTDEVGNKKYGTCLAVRGLAVVEETIIGSLQRGVQAPPPNTKMNNALYQSLSVLSLNVPNKEVLQAKIQVEEEKHFEQCVAYSRESLTACFVLLSSFPAYQVARNCLMELVQIFEAEKKGVPSGAAERFIWWLTTELVIPPNGCVGVSFKLPRSNHPIQFGPFDKPSMPLQEISLLPLFQHLGLGNIVTVLAQLILEQPVVFHSDSYPLLTTITEGFLSLLYPLQWRATYLPVVPSNLTELLEAPGLFIYGVLSKFVFFLSFLFFLPALCLPLLLHHAIETLRSISLTSSRRAFEWIWTEM